MADRGGSAQGTPDGSWARQMTHLVHDLVIQSAARRPEFPALRVQDHSLDYSELASQMQAMASGLLTLGLQGAERVGIYLEKRVETVTALLGVSAAGGTFVPVNPVLKAEQVVHILIDCSAGMLITSGERLRQLASVLVGCRALRTVIVTDLAVDFQALGHIQVVGWPAVHVGACDIRGHHRRIDSDVAAILYTSGSTGKAKGVVVSHRNLVAGAYSVCSYLENHHDDRLLCLLPLSFDYGLNQLLTAFCTGGTAVLVNHVLAQDIPIIIRDEAITGLAAVPPLWIQLAAAHWPPVPTLRYITNSGGAMPRATLDALRSALPHIRIYLMYGLTEAFRSTYLPPEQLDRRPDSIGHAVPNADILVLRDDGTPCAPNEPGELVHRGVLVSLGYWNDPARTAERFRPVPAPLSELPLPEIAVWSGDTVRRDEDGFLYYIGRRDDMIKTSGYRVSPTEIEEILYSVDSVLEAVAFGVPHSVLGQVIAAVVVLRPDATLVASQLLATCKRRLPAYMCPSHIDVRPDPLPRNANGKLDRRAICEQFRQRLFAEAP